MRFSLFHIPSSLAEKDDQAVLEMTVEQSIMADRQGYHGIFLPEHHFTGYAPAGADPVAFAAYLAPQLKRAWLGFAVAVAPLWHPARFVERMNLLDHLTKGKLLVGVGSGVSAVEHTGMGCNTDEMNAGMTEEILDIALKLWSRELGDPELSIGTKYYKGTILERVVPGPYTKPHPKLMRAATRPESIKRAAASGWPVFVMHGDGRVNFLRRLQLYRQELIAAGHDEDTLAHCRRWTTLTATSVAVADTTAEAHALVLRSQSAQDQYFHQTAPSMKRAYELGTTSRAPIALSFASPRAVKNDTIFGTPEQVIEQIQEIEACGVGNLMLSFNYGAYDPGRRSLMDEQQRRFAEQIMPHFSDADPSRKTLEMNLAPHIAATEVEPEAIAHPLQRGI